MQYILCFILYLKDILNVKCTDFEIMLLSSRSAHTKMPQIAHHLVTFASCCYLIRILIIFLRISIFYSFCFIFIDVCKADRYRQMFLVEQTSRYGGGSCSLPQPPPNSGYAEVHPLMKMIHWISYSFVRCRHRCFYSLHERHLHDAMS